MDAVPPSGVPTRRPRRAAAPAPGPLAVVYRPLDSLVPYAQNSRTHSPEQVARLVTSIREFGWTNPVLIGRDGGIIAGHARVLAARDAGIDPVPCIELAHLSDKQRRALVVADNQLAISGAGWDLAMLHAELGLIRQDGFDLTNLLGFEAPELASLFDRHSGLTDPDAAPPLPKEPVCRARDVWRLGRHRLVCGDATTQRDVELCLGLEAPHLMVTDPPYGVSYDADWRNRAVMISGERVGQHGSRAIGVVTNDDRADWTAAWKLFPGAVAYAWHGGLHTATVQASFADAGLDVRAQIVWIKTRPVISRGAYHWQHEPALYAVRPDEPDGWQRFVDDHEVAGYAVRRGKRSAWQGGRKQSTVWFIEHLKSDTGHSTQKPVECMRRPMENNSRPGDQVYDPFVGSGTSIIAAEMSGRACFAIDIDPAYCDVAIERWQAFTGGSAVLEPVGDTFEATRVVRRPKRRRAA